MNIFFIFLTYCHLALYFSKTRVGANDIFYFSKDFIVKDLWHTKKYPCKQHYKENELDVVVVLPISRRRPETQKYFGKQQNQSTMFKPLFDYYKKVFVKYYLYQIADESVSCDYWNYYPNEKFRGADKPYIYNYDWMFYQFENCVLSLIPITSGNSTQRKRVILFINEEYPEYDRWSRYVKITDRLPYEMTGRSIANNLKKYSLMPIFITRPANHHNWLDFVHRLQVPSRKVLTMTPDLASQLPFEIDQMICTENDEPNNDYYFYYLDTLNIIEKQKKHNFQENPLYFVFVFPHLTMRPMKSTGEAFQIYALMPLIASLINYHYPQSKIGIINYYYGGDKFKNTVCLDVVPFRIYTEMNRFLVKKTWSDTYANNEVVTSSRIRSIGGCIDKLFEDDKYDHNKVKARLPIIVSFDYKDMLKEADAPIDTDVVTEFFWQVVHRYAFVHSVITDLSYVERTNLRKTVDLINNSHHHTVQKTSKWTFFPAIVNTIVTNTEQHIRSYYTSIQRLEENALSTKVVSSRQIKTINILMVIPEYIQRDLLPGLTYFAGSYKQQFQRLLQPIGSPYIHVTWVSYGKYPGDQTILECIPEVPFGYDINFKNTILRRNIENFEYETYSKLMFPKFMVCGMNNELWTTFASKTTLNLLVGFSEENLDKIPTVMLEDPSETVESLERKVFDYLYEKKIYPVFIVKDNIRDSVEKLYPLAIMGSFRAHSSLAAEMSRIIYNVLTNE